MRTWSSLGQKSGTGDVAMCSMVEQAQAGVHQCDSQLVAGLDDHLVRSGA